MESPDGKEKSLPLSHPRLKRLNKRQIRQIDMVLESVGDYGDVRLIVRRGQFMYIHRVESQRAWDSQDTNMPDS